MELHTQRQIVALLKERGIRPSRALGQNFLVDRNLLRYIARQAELSPRDVVLDVGAGTGLLTRHLAESGAAVLAVEIDSRLAEICRDYVRDFPNVELLLKDALSSKHELDSELIARLKAKLAEPGRRALKVVCNLPYVVSAPLIVCLLESDLAIERMILTVQKEVAERLSADPDSSAYGALSVVTQVHATVKLLRTLPPEVFWPRPKVHSAIVRLTPSDEALRQIADYGAFRDVTRAAFAHRRKTLANSLAASFRGHLTSEDIRCTLEELGIEPARRGESLSVEELIALANCIASLGRRGTY